MVFAIQTFGDYGRWHPHLHALVADGLFTETGYFYVLPKADTRPLAELFRAHVLKMLKKEGLIDDAFIKKLLSWRHTSGFSVHNKVRIKPDDRKGLENLAQYIVRNSFSLSKLTYLPETDSVIYRLKMTHGKNKKNFKLYSPLEFIAAITQHIPEMSFQLVRYYGWYSNRMRGDRRKEEEIQAGTQQGVVHEKEIEVIDIGRYRPKRIPSLVWRECIKKVWEVDPLTCPKCAGEMRIISFIHERVVIKKILFHLGLYREENVNKQRAPPKQQKPTPIQIIEYESYDDGWPGYEEESVDVKML